MPEVLDGVPRRVAGWAVGRSLAPNSVAGISLALGICAAAWFSAGTRPDNIKGALALVASYLAWCAARWLAGPAGAMSGASARARAARPAIAGAGTLTELCGAASDDLVYAGLAVGGYEAHWRGMWELATAVVIAVAVRRTAVACGGHVARVVGEGNPLGTAIRGFLAYSSGGRVAVIVVTAPVWGAHATLLILLEWGIIATAYVITGHGPDRVAVAGAGEPPGPAGPIAAVASSMRIESSASRMELPGITEFSGHAEVPDGRELPVRDGLPALSDPASPADPLVAEASVQRDLVSLDPPASPDSPVLADGRLRADSPRPADSRAAVPSAALEHSSVPAVAAVPTAVPGLSASAALTRLASGGGPSQTPQVRAGAPEPTMTLELMIPREPVQRYEPGPRSVLDSRTRETIAAYRDDGAAAVWLGRVVRGQFVPLPPAVAGLIATSFLAWLGMRNLPGVLLLTPLVVMLLAAFGSSHPHDGRLDWLVPAMLLAGQLVYIAAIGFSFAVPAPLTFALCVLITLRYVELAGCRRRNAAPVAETRLGWEGRMLAAGLGAMLGITVIAYAVLAAYVAALVWRRVRTSAIAPGVAEHW
jgi:hypothetical protein